MNDELANDRTFLAWLRTGIACFGLGFVVAKAALIIEAGGKPISNKDVYGGTGVLIVLSGAALVIAGYFQHRRVRHVLGAERYPRIDGRSRRRWSRLSPDSSSQS